MDLNIASVTQYHSHESLTKLIFNIVLIFLSQVASIQDLGVIMDSTLSFVNHIDTIVSKALGMLGYFFLSS